MSRIGLRQEKLFKNTELSEGELIEEKTNKTGKDKGCVFCAIVSGERSQRQVILEDHFSLAFLDKRPVFFGHTLVIPKNHYETLSDLPNDLIGPLFSNVQLIAKAVQSGLEAEGTFIAINNKISQSVPHLHIHVIPRRSRDGLKGFFWPRQKYESEKQAGEIADLIKRSLKELRP